MASYVLQAPDSALQQTVQDALVGRRRQASLSPPRSTGRQPRQSSTPKAPPKAVAKQSSSGRTNDQPDTDGDEALALRMQMEEQAEFSGSPQRAAVSPQTGISDEELALMLAAEESGIALSPHRTSEDVPASHTGLSDEALAALLQEEEDHEQSRGHEPRAASRNNIDDAELASMLQREEEANARRGQPQQYRRSAPRFDPSEEWPANISRPGEGIGDRRVGDMSGADLLPQIAQSCGCGDNATAPATIASGCFAGCQIASCFGLGFTQTILFSIGGGLVGLLSSNGPVNLRMPTTRYEEEESDDEPANAGVGDSVINSRTAEHVFSKAATTSSGGTANAGVNNDENKCMICMEHFADGEVLRTLPCLHRYHKQCVDTWLHRSAICPICKRDVTDTSAPVETSRPVVEERRRSRNIMSSLTQRLGRLGRSRANR